MVFLWHNIHLNLQSTFLRIDLLMHTASDPEGANGHAIWPNLSLWVRLPQQGGNPFGCCFERNMGCSCETKKSVLKHALPQLPLVNSSLCIQWINPEIYTRFFHINHDLARSKTRERCERLRATHWWWRTGTQRLWASHACHVDPCCISNLHMLWISQYFYIYIFYI